MSDSKKMPSPYVVFENRSLDQWKVTELKEELKRRKLLTRGLKEDLVKRLDEAIRADIEEANQNHENGDKPEAPFDDAIVEPIVSEKDNITEKLDEVQLLEKDKVTENFDNENRENTDMPVEIDRVHKELVSEGEQGTVSTGIESFQMVQEVTTETSVTVSEVMVSEQNDEINKEEVSNLQESKPLQKEEEEEAEPNSSEIGSQVVEVSQVKSDSKISIVSITEKNELKDNVITDDVKLELDVNPSVLDDGGKTEPVVVDEKDFKKNDILDDEKLNLDDDSMEEDGLESKQIDLTEKTQVPLVDVMVEDKNTETQSTKNETGPAVLSTKRKQNDQENSEVVKRQRRWNSEKAPEQQNINSPSLSTTPKGMLQTSMKHSFSRSDSSASHEEPKEHVVPPSSKPATTSLRIDRFLRPFTLKAVQELVGKTGTVVSFWMDHIKTHCYVTYSSVEEAVETRNAVYNLQWPANGGRLLIAEFVDPSEVKTRTEPPTPATTLPQAPPPAATQPQHHHLPPPPPLPLPLPPPPPLSLPVPPQSTTQRLPPPPPLPEKLEPPIMTLDDLFRKTRATPRIYYLPLSNEQVAGKLKAQGKTVKQ